jgi:hypothetical protein
MSIRAFTTARVASLEEERDFNRAVRRGKYIGGEGKCSDSRSEEYADEAVD